MIVVYVCVCVCVYVCVFVCMCVCLSERERESIKMAFFRGKRMTICVPMLFCSFCIPHTPTRAAKRKIRDSKGVGCRCVF